MTRDETFALWKKCQELRGAAIAEGRSRKEAQELAAMKWNEWADPTIDELRELKFDQRSLSKRLSTEGRLEWKHRQSKEAQTWLDKSKVDFSEAEISVGTLQATIDFTGYRFPGEVDFTESAFRSYARFRQLTFPGPTWFRSTMFAADANFQLCCFTGNAWFRSAKFLEYATFEQATFHAEADFFAVASSHGLLISKAKFIEVPQFNQANFKEALDLDAVDYPIPGFLNRTLTASPMHYRALRRFAQEGHDIENETKAFKGEIRSKRGTEDKIWHAAFWIGVLYDAVSDFGRSILRPFLIWAISIPLFTVAYLAHAGKLATIAAGCSSGSYVIKALLFALKNAVLFVSWDREQIRSAYVCLYDLQSAAQNFAVPPTNAFLQAVQSVWSAVLIFLFLLAVRNQFRIK